MWAAKMSEKMGYFSSFNFLMLSPSQVKSPSNSKYLGQAYLYNFISWSLPLYDEFFEFGLNLIST